jgi:hypothetical protein
MAQQVNNAAIPQNACGAPAKLIEQGDCYD